MSAEECVGVKAHRCPFKKTGEGMVSSPNPMFTQQRTMAGQCGSGNLLAVGSMMTWAVGFPAAEILLIQWDPLSLMTMRLFLAVIFLLPIWVLLEGAPALCFAHWRRAIWVGGLGFGLGTYLFLVAQKLTDPVTVALVASAAPVFAAFIEFAYRMRRLKLYFGLGVHVVMIGGMIATGACLRLFSLGVTFARYVIFQRLPRLDAQP